MEEVLKQKQHKPTRIIPLYNLTWFSYSALFQQQSHKTLLVKF